MIFRLASLIVQRQWKKLSEITSAALKGAHVSPQVLVATVILRRDGRRKQQARLLKLQEDKEDFYKKVIYLHCLMFQTHIGFLIQHLCIICVFTLCPKRLVGAPARPPLPMSPLCSDVCLCFTMAFVSNQKMTPVMTTRCECSVGYGQRRAVRGRRASPVILQCNEKQLKKK